MRAVRAACAVFRDPSRTAAATAIAQRAPQQLRPYRTQIVRRALNEELLAAIERETDAARDSVVCRNNTQTQWCSLERLSRPRCAIEVAIGALSPYAQRSGEPGAAPLVGAEWWTQRRDGLNDSSMFLHFDTDQALQKRHGAMRFPLLSSVMYFTSAGGPTAILAQCAALSSSWFSAERIELQPAEPDEMDLVLPRRNSYCIFQGDLLHGVLPPLIELSAQGTPTPWTRTTLLINWWTGTPPDGPDCSEPSAELLDRLHRAHDQDSTDQRRDWRQSQSADMNDSAEKLPLETVDVSSGGVSTSICLGVSLGEATSGETTVTLLLPDVTPASSFTVVGMERLRFRDAVMDKW